MLSIYTWYAIYIYIQYVINRYSMVTTISVIPVGNLTTQNTLQLVSALHLFLKGVYPL